MRAVAQVFTSDLSALEVSAEDAHHLLHVLRLESGERVVASDGTGAWRECRFRGGPSLRVDSLLKLEPDGPVVQEPKPDALVTVGFVPVKGERPEWVVQKLTEVGVDRIAIVRSSRSVVRWPADRAEKTLGKLRRVAREAAAQSRRAWLPEIAGVMNLSELSAYVAPDVVALAEPGAAPCPQGTTTIAVGPEGGWEAAELSAATKSVGLAPFILRAETAAVAAGLTLVSSRAGAG